MTVFQISGKTLFDWLQLCFPWFHVVRPGFVRRHANFRSGGAGPVLK